MEPKKKTFGIANFPRETFRPKKKKKKFTNPDNKFLKKEKIQI